MRRAITQFGANLYLWSVHRVNEGQLSNSSL